MKSILVDLADFRIDVADGGALTRRITDFAVGRDGHHTATAATALSGDRELVHISSTYPPPHGGARMPHAMFFNDGSGCAFHEGDTAVASHGCIHLSAADAAWLFHWAGAAPVGLAFHGAYPADPVSAKVYRQGAANMCRAVVAEIQDALRGAGCPVADAAGDFDPATAAAVSAFQAAHGLTVDGRVGSQTAGPLGVTL